MWKFGQTQNRELVRNQETQIAQSFEHLNLTDPAKNGGVENVLRSENSHLVRIVNRRLCALWFLHPSVSIPVENAFLDDVQEVISTFTNRGFGIRYENQMLVVDGRDAQKQYYEICVNSKLWSPQELILYETLLEAEAKLQLETVLPLIQNNKKNWKDGSFKRYSLYDIVSPFTKANLNFSFEVLCRVAIKLRKSGKWSCFVILDSTGSVLRISKRTKMCK